MAAAFFLRISKRDKVKMEWMHAVAQVCLSDNYKVLLLFFLGTKTTAPGLQVNWKKKNWKSCFEQLNFHFWHTILTADKTWKEIIKDSHCAFWPLPVVVTIQAQSWRSAAHQTWTEFKQSQRIMKNKLSCLTWKSYNLRRIWTSNPCFFMKKTHCVQNKSLFKTSDQVLSAQVPVHSFTRHFAMLVLMPCI